MHALGYTEIKMLIRCWIRDSYCKYRREDEVYIVLRSGVKGGCKDFEILQNSFPHDCLIALI